VEDAAAEGAEIAEIGADKKAVLKYQNNLGKTPQIDIETGKAPAAFRNASTGKWLNAEITIDPEAKTITLEEIHNYGEDGYCEGCGEFIFKDVTSGEKYVSWAYKNKIVTGTSATTFSPKDNCTRLQFVMMLWKMNGEPKVKTANPFEDVTGSKASKAVAWAVEEGIINSGAKFNPNGNITRVNIVMILWKMAGSPKVSVADNPFTDVTGSKTTKAVLWAYQQGITKGTSATTFAPNADCTRIQLVTFLYKYNGKYHVV